MVKYASSDSKTAKSYFLKGVIPKAKVFAIPDNILAPFELWITEWLVASKICDNIPEVVVLPLVPVTEIQVFIYLETFFKNLGSILSVTNPIKEVPDDLPWSFIIFDKKRANINNK